MSPTVADRLARLAVRRRADGGLGWSARWARRRLIAAGGRFDRRAREALWWVWAADPDEACWRTLARWQWAVPEAARFDSPVSGIDLRQFSLVALGDGAAAPEAVARCAALAAHPVARTARRRVLDAGTPELVDAVCAVAVAGPGTSLVEFCAEHRLAPADPVVRAGFFLLCGQVDQYRAVDPDGALVAAYYPEAPAGQQVRLRAALAAVGGLDTVRVLAGPRLSSARLAPAEVEYLVADLAGRGAWSQLWRLVLDLPVADLLAAMPRFDGTWRPAGSPGPELFDRLHHAAGRVHLKVALAGLGRHKPLRAIEVDTAGVIRGGGFAPDGRQLITVEQAGSGAEIVVYALPGGEQVERHRLAGTRVPADQGLGPAHVAHLGDSAVVSVNLRDRLSGVCTHYRLAGGQLTRLGGAVAGIRGMVLCPGGYVSLVQHQDCFTLDFHDRDARVTHTVELDSRLGLGQRGWFEFGSCLAVDHATGRIAIAGRTLTILAAGAAEVLATVNPDEDLRSVCFAGSDRLVTGEKESRRPRRGVLTAWRLGPAGLAAAASWDEPVVGVERPVPVLGGHQIALLTGEWSALARVRHVQPATLAGATPCWGLDGEVALPTVARWSAFWQPRPHLCATPDGGRYALLTGRRVKVVDAYRSWLAAFVDQPLAQATHPDLTLLAAMRPQAGETDDLGEVLDLLEACLEHRLGGDVVIGECSDAGARAYDIELAATHDQSQES